jgi:serine/threonine protein kinase
MESKSLDSVPLNPVTLGLGAAVMDLETSKPQDGRRWDSTTIEMPAAVVNIGEVESQPQGGVLSNTTTFESRAAVRIPAFLGAAYPSKYIHQKISLGKGACGEAWLVQRACDCKMFVAKILDLKNTPVKRREYAMAEIRCLKDCDHPNVIRYVEDSGTDGEQVIIIMELADSCDLGTHIRQSDKPFTDLEAGVLFTQLILALHFIHRKRVLHRDIKPGNIFLTQCGLLKVGDFGFSQQYDQTVSDAVAGTFLGTHPYMSPELWEGKRYGKKADVWAAGVVLHELLAGCRPFRASNLAELKCAVLEGKIEPLPGRGRAMMELIHVTLNPDPSRRPSTAQLLAMPIMQQLLATFHGMVRNSRKVSPVDKDRIVTAIAEAQCDATHLQRSTDEVDSLSRYTSAVKLGADGVWKDRVLILQPPHLIMTLAHGKVAAPGSESSKSIDLSQITSVTKMAVDGNHYMFGMELANGKQVVLCVPTPLERDAWINQLHKALGM